MAVYRLLRMKEHVRQQFRWAPHTMGMTNVKPKEYEEAGTVEGESLYAIYLARKGTPEALCIGDVLESESGELRIYKYVGFEQAQWQLPEVKTGLESTPPAAGAAAPVPAPAG